MNKSRKVNVTERIEQLDIKKGYPRIKVHEWEEICQANSQLRTKQSTLCTHRYAT